MQKKIEKCMAALHCNIDNVLEAMYGKPEPGTELYSSYYKYELNNIYDQYREYISMCVYRKLPTKKKEIAKILLFLERLHIDNETLVAKNLNIHKLYDVCKRLVV